MVQSLDGRASSMEAGGTVRLAHVKQFFYRSCNFSSAAVKRRISFVVHPEDWLVPPQGVFLQWAL